MRAYDGSGRAYPPIYVGIYQEFVMAIDISLLDRVIPLFNARTLEIW